MPVALVASTVIGAKLVPAPVRMYTDVVVRTVLPGGNPPGTVVGVRVAVRVAVAVMVPGVRVGVAVLDETSAR